MKGLIKIARRAVMTRLKADSGLTALVDADQIYPQAPLTEPVWPFIKMGRPQALPYRARCLDGQIITFPVHAFARAEYTNGAITKTAEDLASDIGEQIEQNLDFKGEAVESGTVQIGYELTDIQLMPDSEESDAFHWFANVRCKCLAE